MICYKLTVKGLVQGVGFRPYIAALAEELNIKGEVYNAGGIVYIKGVSSKETMNELIHRLLLLDGENEDLPLANVTDIELDENASEYKLYDGTRVGNATEFRIVKSASDSDNKRILPIDIATCPNCERELFDPNNRRYRYPFISCASCGPRYSLMRSVPYDREETSMAEFKMCKDCEAEYKKVGDIRCYAQTIACEKCGPKLMGYRAKSNIENIKLNVGMSGNARINGDKFLYSGGETAFSEAVTELKNGGIVAIKDPTGYHLAFDVFNRVKAGERLREYKHRENKPFAVMFDSVETIREFCEISDKELELLTNVARPIVLLDRRREVAKSKYVSLTDKEVLKGSNKIGAMLPSNPLQLMLLKEFKALVMTSGNISGRPIETEDEVMLAALNEGRIDYVLSNNREILYGLDDSVLQLVEGHTQFVRRSRGYVPLPVRVKGYDLKEGRLALGGDMKATFAYGVGENAYLGGYFGDLSDYSCFNKWKASISHMRQMLGIAKEGDKVGDLHPSYISARNADLKIQHHYAHILSVMAEHGLKSTLGVAFDGTGYGDDQTIWGGEFLLCDEQGYNRVATIAPVKLAGGDSSAKDCDLTAICYLREAVDRGYLSDEKPYECLLKDLVERASVNRQGVNVDNNTRSKLAEHSKAGELDKESKSARWELVSKALDMGVNVATSTSMGRLFDAVSAVLDVCHENGYESEAPIKLEIAAEECEDEELTLSCPIRFDDNLNLYVADTVKLFSDIVSYKNDGVDKKQLAFAFHKALAYMVLDMCEIINNKSYPISMSGGTMNNKLLMTMLIRNFESRGYSYYINEQVEAGDGGLALGQLIAGMLKEDC